MKPSSIVTAGLLAVALAVAASPLPASARPLHPYAVPPGGYPNGEVNNGSFSQFAPNDPERPYGANSTVTAPPGSDAAKEQENNRRYFCNYAPEHC